MGSSKLVSLVWLVWECDMWHGNETTNPFDNEAQRGELAGAIADELVRQDVGESLRETDCLEACERTACIKVESDKCAGTRN